MPLWILRPYRNTPLENSHWICTLRTKLLPLNFLEAKVGNLCLTTKVDHDDFSTFQLSNDKCGWLEISSSPLSRMVVFPPCTLMPSVLSFYSVWRDLISEWSIRRSHNLIYASRPPIVCCLVIGVCLFLVWYLTLRLTTYRIPSLPTSAQPIHGNPVTRESFDNVGHSSWRALQISIGARGYLSFPNIRAWTAIECWSSCLNARA